MDDIEQVMQLILKSQENLTGTTTLFQDSLVEFQSSLSELKRDSFNYLKGIESLNDSDSLPQEWNEIISYSIANDISTEYIMQMIKIFNGDFIRKKDSLSK